MKKILTVALILAASIKKTDVSAQSKTGLHLLHTFHISGIGGWDYIEISPVHDWLYVSHSSRVNVLNKMNGDSVGTLENTTGVHGIAFDISANKGFTSNGRLNTVTVFDMNTNRELGQIPAGQNPDAIFYEPFLKKIITCNGTGKNLSIIDPLQNKVIDSIYVGGKPETAVSDGEGKVYVNIEDKNEVVAIDIKTLKVLSHWSLSPAEGPTGLAFDKSTNRLFAGCDKLLVVLDAATGRQIQQLPIGDGCDGVAFDPSTKNIYTANGEGNMTVIHEDAPDKYSVVETVQTKKGARTIVFDKKTHVIYLPTGEFEPVVEGQKRAKIKPETFQVLVFGK